jgi:TP901 family phage tail tape measure protein
MTTLTSSLIVRVLDQVSGPARGISRSILGIRDAANRAGNLSFGDRLQGAMARNNAALDQVRGQVFDAVASFYVLKQALTAPITSAVKFESAMADIAKVTNFDDSGLKAYGKALRKLSVTEIPLAVNDLAALSAAAAQAGVPEAELFDFTRLTAKAAVAWEMTGAQTGEALAKIRTALGLTNEQTSKYADLVNYLSDSTAASAPDMIDFTKRVASQGEFFGYTKEETLAFGAAMVSAGFDADVSATSFRNMGKALTRGVSASKSQRTAWKRLGMDGKKVAKAMQKDAVGTTLKVIEALGKLPEHLQAATMSDLFGDEARALAPLLNNTELLRKALSMTADEQNYLNSVGREFEKRAATSEYKLQRFKSQLNDIALTIGGALLPGLTKLLEPLGEFALKVSNFAEAHPDLIAKIVTATGAVIGFRAAIVSLKWLGLLGRGGVLSVIAFGFNTLGRAIIGATNAAKNATGLQAALAGMSGAKYTRFQKVADGFKAIALAIPGVSGISGAISGIGAAVAAISAPALFAVALGVAAVAGAGFLLWKYWDRASSVFSGVARAIADNLAPVIDRVKEKFRDMWSSVRDSVGDVAEYFGADAEAAKAALDRIFDFSAIKQKISDFFSWLGSFFQREVLSDEQKASLEASAYDVTDRIIKGFAAGTAALLQLGADMIQSLWDGMLTKVDEMIAWVKTIPQRIVAAFGKIDLGSLIGFSTPGGGGEAVPAVDGARAAGGPVKAGGTYLVGEEGPELFQAKQSGSIWPNGETVAALRKSGTASAASGGNAAQGTVGGVVMHINPTVHINGVQDIRGAAREISQMLADEIRQNLDASFADLGVRR